MNGAPQSPYVYETRDNDGNVVCHFEVAYTTTTPFPIINIVAFNATASPYTQIQVTNSTTGQVKTLPLPTNGPKSSVTLQDGTVVAGWFKATVSKAAVNAAGFINLGDIGTYTVF